MPEENGGCRPPNRAQRASLLPELFAVSALVALGTLLGRKVCIRPKRHDDWPVAANLWGFVAMRPSTKKSDAIKNAMKPLYDFVAEAQKEYDAATTDAKGREVILASKLKGLKAQATKLASHDVPDQAKIDAANERIVAAMKEQDGLAKT